MSVAKRLIEVQRDLADGTATYPAVSGPIMRATGPGYRVWIQQRPHGWRFGVWPLGGKPDFYSGGMRETEAAAREAAHAAGRENVAAVAASRKCP